MVYFMNIIARILLVVKEDLWFFGNRRGSTRIWGCVGGEAAYTPPNLEFVTVNPNDPDLLLNLFLHGYNSFGPISFYSSIPLGR
jgi:hypothetical protein